MSLIGPSGHNTVRTLTEENARLREVTEAQSRAIEALRQAGADKRRQLTGAVEALTEWLAADDDAERDYTPESEARLDAAIRVARAIVGGQ